MVWRREEQEARSVIVASVAAERNSLFIFICILLLLYYLECACLDGVGGEAREALEISWGETCPFGLPETYGIGRGCEVVVQVVATGEMGVGSSQAILEKLGIGL